MKLSVKSKKSFFYHLQIMLNAGIPISEGVKNYKSGKLGSLGLKWSDQMRVEGRPLSSLMLTSKMFESYEIGLVKVGEKSGQIVEILKGLDEWYEKHLVAQRKLILGALYPSFVLFLLPIIMNIPSLFEKGTFADYLIKVALFYVPYLVFVLFIFFVLPEILKTKGVAGRLLEEILFRIPMVGKYIRDNHIKKIAFANGLALQSGIGVAESLTLTLSVTQSPVFRRDIENAIHLSKSGVSYYELISHFKWLDEESKSLIATSEKTGSVSDGMNQIYSIKTAENEARSMILIIIFGVGILLYALGMVAYHIITATLKYVNMFDEISK